MTGHGGLREGSGRPQGIPNRSTTKARETIAEFVNDSADLLKGWLERIAETNPKAAFDCFVSVCEYHIPKLQRSEVDLTVKKQSMTYEEMIALRDMMLASRGQMIEHKPEAPMITVEAVDAVEVQEGEIVGKAIQRETVGKKPKRKRLSIEAKIAALKTEQNQQPNLSVNETKQETLSINSTNND